MARFYRPLSPHLQIYKPQITSVLSILHRMTGMALAVGAVMLSLWLYCIAFMPVWAEWLLLHGSDFPLSWFVPLFLWALCYHGLNGVRHLLWDWGVGLSLGVATFSGWLVVILSALLTLWVMV